MRTTRTPFSAALAEMSPLSIPQHWSPEQALAVWELFDEIAHQIWDRYELAITELIDPGTEETMPQTDLFDDEDIPF